MFKIIGLACLVLSLNSAWSKELKFKSLADLDKCERANSYDTGVCYEPLKAYVKSHPKEALAVAVKARRVFASWVSLEWFDMAITKNKKKEVCGNSEFHISFLNALGQSPTSPAYLMAKKLFLGTCQTDLIPVVFKELDSSQGTDFVELVCPALKKVGKAHANCEPKKDTQPVAVVEEKLPVVEKSKIKLSTSVKVFRGPEGSKMSMVKVTGDQGLYLVKIEGVESPWNEKVLLHKEDSTSGGGSADFWTENDGKKWNTIIKRNCYQGFCNYEVYVPGTKGAMSFSYDEKESKTADSSVLLKNF